MLRRLIRLGVGLAAGLAVLALPAAWLLDTFAGGDYWLYEAKADAPTFALEKAQWRADHADGKSGSDEDVVSIYGAPFSRERVILASKDRVRRPEERPSLALLDVRKSKGENPLQAKTVLLLARYAAIGGAAAAILGLVLLRAVAKSPPIA